MISRGTLLTLSSAPSLLHLHVIPRHIEYFYLLDDPFGNGFVVRANHPSGHQIEGSPWEKIE